MTTTTIRVHTTAPYPVLIGSDLLDRVPELVGSTARRAAVLHQPGQAARAGRIGELLVAAGIEPLLLPTPDGEAAKTAAVAAHLWDELGANRFTRSDVVIGVGGGATTDLAGFVAATWMRGIRVVQVPTTLLAMVDAAVGGKTGINTAAGKNLVGAIHEPAGVLCDLATLTTLPEPDLVAGLAEVIKAGFIVDERILVVAEQAERADLVDPARAGTSQPLREIIERAIRVKADVVAGDLYETSRALGGREILNYGHTLAHAIEKVSGYRWRHGAAVSVGMVFAAELAQIAGRLGSADVQRHRALLGRVGLPICTSGPWEPLAAAMVVDKKARGSLVRFVVLDGIGHPGFLDGPDSEWLVEAYSRITPRTDWEAAPQ